MSDSEGTSDNESHSPQETVTSTVQPALKTDSAFASFINGLQADERTMILFDRRDYYSAHGPHAVQVARDYYKTLAALKYSGDGLDKMPYICLSHNMFATVVRDVLLVRNGKVEVYAAARGTSSGWKKEKIASPGNLTAFENILYGSADMEESSVLASVKLCAKGLVALAYCDNTNRTFGTAELEENEGFSNTEAFLLQIGAKECLVPMQDTPELRKLRSVLERSNVLASDRKLTDFNDKDVEQDLKRLLKNSQTGLFDLSKNQLGAVGAIIKYLDMGADETNFGKFRMASFVQAEYMRLDNAAVNALNLFPTGAVTAGGKTGTLYGLLNKCKTAMGSRLLLQWVKQPLLDITRIQRRQDLVAVFFNDNVIRQTLSEEHLKKVPDISKIVKKITKGTANLQDVVRLYQAVARVPDIKATLESFSGDEKPVLDAVFAGPLGRIISDCAQLLNMIEHTIDLSRIENHEYLINPSFDDELQELMQKKDDVLDKIAGYLDRAADDLGLDNKKLKLDRNDQFGYYLRLPRSMDSVVKNDRNYFTLEARKDGIRFTCSGLKKLSAQFTELSQAYNSKQAALVSKAMEIVATYIPVLEELNAIVAQLDVLVALATVAATAPIPYVRPTLSEAGRGNLVLRAARHPCLEVQDGVNFIPNDVVLERNGKMMVIITGPNMGGKSTYIRTAGIVTVMAHIGSFVPCESAEVCVTDRILARLGAGDSQLKGVSTFMAEMIETTAIINSATEASLLIVDELGRGTSTYDGFGLAWAISQHIAEKIRAPTLFATHFHELTDLANQCPSVTNAHVTAVVNENELTLLYSVKSGPCDQSFGIQVAQMAKFPAEVIREAKRKAAELESFGQIHDSPMTSTVSSSSDAAATAAAETDLSSDPSLKIALKKIKSFQASGSEDDMLRGESMIEEYLSEFDQVKTTGDPQDLLRLKTRIRGSENTFIKYILAEEATNNN